MLIGNNGTSGFFRMQPDSSSGDSITIPSASLPLSTARPLWTTLASGMTLYAQFLGYTLPTGTTLSASHALDIIMSTCNIDSFSFATQTLVSGFQTRLTSCQGG